MRKALAADVTERSAAAATPNKCRSWEYITCCGDLLSMVRHENRREISLPIRSALLGAQHVRPEPAKCSRLAELHYRERVHVTDDLRALDTVAVVDR